MKSLLLRTFFPALFSLALFLGSGAILRGQSHYYDHWYFGDSLGLSFGAGAPSFIKGALSTSEGSAVICDPVTGALLFYTDGITVWNRNHVVMQGGTGLMGHNSSTQSALIVPAPSDSALFYIFTSDAILSQDTGINYSVVDMRGDNGRGAVVQKNVHLLKPAVEKLTAVRHCNGNDFWVIAHEARSARFFAWEVTAAGVSPRPVISDAGSPQTSIGYLKSSPNGRYLFSIDQASRKGDLLPFDSRSGAVGAAILTLPAHYGAAFSPDNHFLYVAEEGSTSRLVQYRITSINPGTILTSRVVVDSSFGLYRSLQLAPDRKIYLLNGGISVIEYPNLAGPSCSVVPLPSSRTAWYGLPNCIDGFLGENEFTLAVDPDTTICYGGGTFLHVSGGVGYHWEPSDGLNCDTCADPWASPQHTTTYKVTAFSKTGCPAVGSVTVTVKESPKIVTANDTSICMGGTAQLYVEGGSSYRWEPSEGLSCADCFDPVAAPAVTTTYHVFAFGENGCVARDSIRVSVDSAAVRIVPDAAETCRGVGIKLQALGEGKVEWEPSEGLSCADCPDPVAAPERTTTYTVRLISDGGCLAVDSVTVLIHEVPVVDAGSDTVLCAGDSLRLQGSATGDSISFLWEGGGDISCVDCLDPIVYPHTTTTYVLWATSEWGCAVRDSVTVRVRSEQSLNLSADTAVCAGNSVRLFAEGAERYQWSPADGLSCTDCPDPIASPDRTTTYYVLGVGSSGNCGAVDSVRVTVYPYPIVDAGGDAVVCSGRSLQLRAGGATAYEWDFSPDLSCLDCPDPIASPATTTTYYVTGIDPGGCSARDSVQVVVRSGLEISAGEDQTICAGNSVRLGVDEGVRWEWSPPGGLSCTDCPDPTAAPSSTTTYRVRAWSADGCEGSDEVTVVVRRESEEIPLRIGRGYRGKTGLPLIIPVEMEGMGVATDLTALEFRLEYDRQVMVVDAETIEGLLSGTLLEGWRVEVVQNEAGRVTVLLTAPPGKTLSGSGDLLRFESRMYLAGVQGTELSFSVTAPEGCYTFPTEAGYAELDSICGLSLRLIEAASEKYVAPVVSPNPAQDRVMFEFVLGLSGTTLLEVFDALGNRVGLIVDKDLQPGKYAVEWDIRGLASGVYWYRLRSGDWSRTGQIRIRE